MKNLCFLLLALLGLQVHASELGDPMRPTWSLGMGGVVTPFPREVDMITVNASYLARVKEVGLEIFTLGLGVPGLNAIEEIQGLPSMSSISDLNEFMGLPIWANGSARFSLVTPYFGFSYFSGYTIYTYLNNPLIPEMYVNFLNDTTLVGSFGISVGPGSSFGVSFKRITRWGGRKTLDYGVIDDYIASQDTNVILDELSNKGIGYGADISYLWRPDDIGPIVTLVWRDIGYTTFQKTSGPGAPPSNHENLVLGLGYEAEGSIFGFKAGLEYDHITTQNMQLGKKLHLGTELSLPLVDLRAGLNQGYTTLGFGLDLWVFRLEVAQFTEEVGVYPGQDPSSRIQLGLTLDLSVDADFRIFSPHGDGSGGSGSSKRRKLKQRR